MFRLKLILQAYMGLLAHDLFMSRHDFASLHRRIKSFPLRATAADAISIEAVSSSLDIACCFYPKQTMCLQRSSVLVAMLRAKGVPAHMVIGAQKLPFKAHAWAEVNGQIINDRVASRESFLVLEVC
jgi:Transglutaminase-like superfamily